jgi:predicted nucleotidyltransferase
VAAATLDEVLEVLRARREEAREKYKVELVGVVGSLARGDARPDSDVDIFAEFLSGATLFKIGGLASELEQRLGRPVDLVDRKMVRPFMRSEMERDLVPA